MDARESPHRTGRGPEVPAAAAAVVPTWLLERECSRCPTRSRRLSSSSSSASSSVELSLASPPRPTPPASPARASARPRPVLSAQQPGDPLQVPPRPRLARAPRSSPPATPPPPRMARPAPPPPPPPPSGAMMTSDELDWLVYSYLEESGPSSSSSSSSALFGPAHTPSSHPARAVHARIALTPCGPMHAGYHHTSFSLLNESHLAGPSTSSAPPSLPNGASSSSTAAAPPAAPTATARNPVMDQVVPPGHLVRLLQKGLLYLEAEARYRGVSRSRSPLVLLTCPAARAARP